MSSFQLSIFQLGISFTLIILSRLQTTTFIFITRLHPKQIYGNYQKKPHCCGGH